MGLLIQLIAGGCHLLAVALDIAVLFCLIRILRSRLPWDILKALDPGRGANCGMGDQARQEGPYQGDGRHHR